MKKIIAAIAISLTLGACATFQKVADVAGSTVPSSAVVPAANSFNILKAAATNYGRYCIAQRMVPAICSAANRRVVVKFVRSGTSARNQLEASLQTGQPALASVYNVLVSAVEGLQASPANSPTFVQGGAQ